MVQVSKTFEDGYTPRCNGCGIALCFDLSPEEYEENKQFWDYWRCSDCNPDYKGALTRFKEQKISSNQKPETK